MNCLLMIHVCRTGIIDGLLGENNMDKRITYAASVRLKVHHKTYTYTVKSFMKTHLSEQSKASV